MNEGNYCDGQPVLLAPRSSEAMIEWQYTDGQSGTIGVPQASGEPAVTKKDAGFFFP